MYGNTDNVSQIPLIQLANAAQFTLLLMLCFFAIFAIVLSRRLRMMPRAERFDSMDQSVTGIMVVKYLKRTGHIYKLFTVGNCCILLQPWAGHRCQIVGSDLQKRQSYLAQFHVTFMVHDFRDLRVLTCGTEFCEFFQPKTGLFCNICSIQLLRLFIQMCIPGCSHLNELSSQTQQRVPGATIVFLVCFFNFCGLPSYSYWLLLLPEMESYHGGSTRRIGRETYTWYGRLFSSSLVVGGSKNWGESATKDFPRSETVLTRSNARWGPLKINFVLFRQDWKERKVVDRFSLSFLDTCKLRHWSMGNVPVWKQVEPYWALPFCGHELSCGSG